MTPGPMYNGFDGQMKLVSGSNLRQKGGDMDEILHSDPGSEVPNFAILVFRLGESLFDEVVLCDADVPSSVWRLRAPLN